MYFKIFQTSFPDGTEFDADSIPNDCEPTDYRDSPRITITTKKSILSHLRYGQYVAEVSIPPGVEITKDYYDCRVDKIIVKNFKPIQEYLKIFSDNEIVNASYCEHNLHLIKYKPELSLEIIKNTPGALQFVENQTPELCLEAVKVEGSAIQFVKEPTPEIIEEAIKCKYKHFRFNPVLKWIKNQTPDLCLRTVKNCGLELEHVRVQTPEICMEAVKQSGHALEYVKNQTPEICMEAIKSCARAIRYVKNQTPELSLCAIKSDASVIEYIKKSTPEVLAHITNSGFRMRKKF